MFVCFWHVPLSGVLDWAPDSGHAWAARKKKHCDTEQWEKTLGTEKQYTSEKLREIGKFWKLQKFRSRACTVLNGFNYESTSIVFIM